MVAAYASCLLIVLAALLLGRGIFLLAGSSANPWLAAPVGLAALMVVCDVAIRLPGRAWTAVVVVVALCAGSAVLVVRRGWSRVALFDALPVVGILLVLVSLPFAANGRFGVIGISYMNDTHWHLLLAQGLREPGIQHLDTYGPGYPLGPHAVAATFAQLIGTGVDRSLTGFLMATPLLTGLAALGLLTYLSGWRRWLVAILAGIPYMLAASFVESAFKEPILALLLLGLVIAVTGWSPARQGVAKDRAIPIAVLIAGIIYDYSYPGLFWVVVCGACWLVASALLSGAWRLPREILTSVRLTIPAALLCIAVFVVLVAPDFGAMHTFYTTNGGTSIGTVGGVTKDALGNLAGPLSSFEGFNLWLTGDFRFVPPNVLQSGVLAGFALMVVAFGVISALERHDAPWLGGAVGMILAYAYVKHAQSPYIAAKAEMLAGPLLMIGGAGALARRVDRRVLQVPASAGFAVALALFAFFAMESSVLALRDAQVGPQNHTDELRALRPVLHGRPTLVLFYDDYFKWELLGVPASSPLLPSPIPVSVQADKPWAYGQALDFDSMSATTLDRFDYVITTRTDAQSQPPPNFRLVATSPSYEVFQRFGPTIPRRILSESGQPGARLICSSPAGRALSRAQGVAAVRDAPVSIAMGPLIPGNSEHVALHLPAGQWNLSLPFTSPQAVTVRGAALDVTLPPNLDRPGSVWPVGNVTSTGAPMTLTFTMQNPGLVSSGRPVTQYFTPQSLVAVHPSPDRLIPLRAACGRYVDWYRLGAGA